MRTERGSNVGRDPCLVHLDELLDERDEVVATECLWVFRSSSVIHTVAM